MTDQSFDARLERALRGYAETAIRPVDAVEIADRAFAAGATVHRVRSISVRRYAWLAVAAILIALLLEAAFLLTVGRRGQLAAVIPTVAPSGLPGALPIELAGSWIAEKPGDLSFGDQPDPARMSFAVESNGRHVYVSLPSGPREYFQSTATASNDQVQVVARAPGDPVTSGGTLLRACALKEIGIYRVARSTDGLRLTLSLIDDACPSRAVVLARTWIRSLGAPNSGGLGVIDAFDPLFTVNLPAGSYSVGRTTDTLTVVQPVPEFQFLAFKDPQGFTDPCDLKAGRYPIEQGADAIVAYFRQLPGFTVDSTKELVVDGHRAVRLVVHANSDASCPDGQLAEWQPKAETADFHWFLRPGDTDSLVIVELADATLMFEVLPAPHPLESSVIDSIRFLEQLPATP